MQRGGLQSTTLALAAVWLLQIGCGGTKPSRFYVLTALPAVPLSAASAFDAVVGIDPPEFPDYLKRPNIVTFTGGNELELAEYDRWAEPLEDNFGRVLRDNVAALLSNRVLVVYPWAGRGKVAYRVATDVLRFEQLAEDTVSLEAHWRVVATEDGRTVAEDTSRLSAASALEEKKKDRDYERVVSTMSDLLAELSREIAAAIEADLE